MRKVKDNPYWKHPKTQKPILQDEMLNIMYLHLN